MLKHVKGLSKSRFVSNVLIVATGTAGAQAIAMAFAPIITRLYGPEAFGLLGTFMAILGIATPVAALTYPIAIVLPRSDKDAMGLAKLSAGLAFIMAVVLAVLILLFGDGLAELLSLQSITGYLLLIPVAMLFAAFHQILQQWLIRKKQFKVTAKVAIFQALALNSAKAGIGWFHPVGAALILLATLGSALHAFMLWLGIRKQPSVHPALDQVETLEAERQTSTFKELAHRHRDFPLYRAPQVAINALSQSLPVLMLASFFGPAAAGFYTLGKTVLGVPSTLIGKSVGDVFYPRITEAAHNNENLFRLILKATLALGAVGFIPFALVIAFGPSLFSFVFGSEWVMAGEYSQWIALWMYFMFMNSPSNKAIPILGIQGLYLFFTIFAILIRLGALALAYFLYESDLMAVAFFSVAGAAINIAIIAIVLFMSFARIDTDGQHAS